VRRKKKRREEEGRKGKEKGEHWCQIPVASPISPPPHSDLRVSLSVCVVQIECSIPNFHFGLLGISNTLTEHDPNLPCLV